MSVSVAIKNAADKCGEGPFWDESTNSLLSMDCHANRIIKWNAKTGKTDIIKFDELCTIILPHKSGGYITTQNNKVVHFDWANPSSTKVVAEVDVGKKTQFNDGKCDKTGRLWAGTSGEVAHLQPEAGTLYSFGKKGKVHSHMDKVTVSNGMTWSLDWKKMYYVDSDPRRVWVFDCDINTGILSNQRLFLQWTPDTLDTLGLPDGMTTDAEGKLWIACYNASKIIRLDPETGKILREVKFPVRRITSLCFGGEDYQDIYVTSDGRPWSEDEFKQQPLAGSVFKVTGLGIKGLPQYAYEG